jgi:hypothetical protein
MRTTLAQTFALFERLRAPAALRRGLMAGTAWGLAVAAALTAMVAWQCGGICIDEMLATAALSIATGIATIGPLAAFGHPVRQSATARR